MAFLYFTVQNDIQNFLRFLGYKATGFFQLLNFFNDHNIGEPVRRKNEVGQGLDFSLACRLKQQGLDSK